MECLIHLYLNNCQHDGFMCFLLPCLLFFFHSVFALLWDYLNYFWYSLLSPFGLLPNRFLYVCLCLVFVIFGNCAVQCSSHEPHLLCFCYSFYFCLHLNPQQHIIIVVNDNGQISSLATNKWEKKYSISSTFALSSILHFFVEIWVLSVIVSFSLQPSFNISCSLCLLTSNDLRFG